MSTRGIRPKSAIDTVATGFGWLLDHPILIGVFLVFGVVDAVLQLSTLLSLLSSVLSLFTAGIAHRYADRILAGETPKLGDATGEVAGRMLSLIGTQILYGLAVLFGLLALIVPGIYVGLRLGLAFPACVIDGKGAIDSLETSWEVAHGNLLKLLGIGLVGATVSILAVVLTAVVGGGVASTTGEAGVTRVVIYLAVGIVGAFVTPAIQMAYARVYLANRNQPEGVDAGESISDDQFDDAFRTV